MSLSGSQSAPYLAVDALLDTLDAWGVRYIFGCPGTTEVPLLDRLLERQRPEFILTTQESVTVSMADGYARATGQPGVVNLHANVGLANGVANLYSAYAHKVPMVVLNGMKPTILQGRESFTTAPDVAEMVKQYCKWDWVVMRGDRVAEDIERAFKISMSPPHGVTFIGLPQDLLEEAVAQGARPGAGFRLPPTLRPDPEALRAAAERLAAAKRPVILVGDQVAQEDALDAVVRLAERVGAAVVAENRVSLGYNPFPMDHPQYCGNFVPGAALIEEADVLFAIGAKVFVEFDPPKRKFIPETCQLLHLHIDPWEIGKLYPTEVGLQGDVRSALDELQTLLDREEDRYQDAWEARRRQVLGMASERRAQMEASAKAVRDAQPIRVTRLAEVLGTIMQDDDVTLISDAVTTNDALFQQISFRNAQSFHANSAGSSLGWGMGAPLGYKMGAPDRKVLGVVGDGVVMFGMAALWTAEHYNIPAVYVVVNNQKYAAVKSGLLRYKGRSAAKNEFIATDISGPNYTEIAKGFGIEAHRIEHPQDIEAAVRDAFAADRPVVLEVMTDPDDVGTVERA